MKFSHPRTSRLQRWLDGEEDSITPHLDTCERCAERLEALISDAPDSLREALLESHRVPPGLHRRLNHQIDDRFKSRSDLTLIGEMFGLAAQTARVVSLSNRGEQ